MLNIISRVVEPGWQRALLSCALACAASACARIEGDNSVYIVVNPQETERFLETMGSLSRENDLDTDFAEATHSPGLVLHLLRARGRSVTLRLANVPLSGKESPLLCGNHLLPYPDPAQFRLYTEPRFRWNSRERADSVQEGIVDRLRSEGYDIRSEPAVCGRAALQGD
jgi:hypothetical protein